MVWQLILAGSNNRVNSDCQKLRRFAMQLLAAGYAKRWEEANGKGNNRYCPLASEHYMADIYPVCPSVAVGHNQIL